MGQRAVTAMRWVLLGIWMWASCLQAGRVTSSMEAAQVQEQAQEQEQDASSPQDASLDRPPKTPEVPSGVPPDSSKVTIQGRAYALPGGDGCAHRFGRPGTTFGVRFVGTGLSLKLERKMGNYDVRFGRILDGQQLAPVRMQGTGPVTLSIAADLPDTEHEVWWTHFGDSVATAAVEQQILLDGAGTWLSPPANPTRVIEVIGGSASTGYGVLPGAGCHGVNDQDPTLAWIHLAAKRLNAVPINSAIAGLGMWWDSGGTHTAIASKVWERVEYLDANLKWSSAPYPAADAVFIDLVNNDWKAFGDDTQGLAIAANGQLWQVAALSFMAKVAAFYPQAFIYLVINNSTSPGRRASLRALLADTVLQAQKAGLAKVSWLEFAYSDQGRGGCGDHPSAAGHQLMADAAVAQLQHDLKW